MAPRSAMCEGVRWKVDFNLLHSTLLFIPNRTQSDGKKGRAVTEQERPAEGRSRLGYGSSREGRYESHSYSSSPRRSSRSRYRSRSRSVDSSDVENPGNNLYVTGLSARVTDRDLEKHFSAEGEVVDASIVLDPWTRESRGFGFVTMATVKEADRCIKYLDHSVLEGRQEKAWSNTNTRKHGGIPQATHLLRETVTGHATHLSENGLILLMVEGHILHTTGVDPTPHMKGGGPTLRMADPLLLMVDGNHTLPMTHMVHGVGYTHLTTVPATVQGLHTVTEERGHVPMTVPFHHTTEGAILRVLEDGAILAVFHLRGATPIAVPRILRSQGAILRGKYTVKGNRRAAGHRVRGTLGRATLTAAVPTQGLFPGSAQNELKLDVL
uniref:RRM domain-containing protein n=1 Tax=Oryza punctata TaxID=4537 RepID=A0A0E0KBP1_ORYPU